MYWASSGYMSVKKLFFLIMTVCLFSGQLWADYPRIQTLSVKDFVFQQLTELVGRFNELSASERPVPALQLFVYTVKKNDDLLTISAACNLPYETIATINRIPHIQALVPGADILIPSQPGLFLSVNPENEIESLCLSWRKPEENQKISFPDSQGKQQAYFFFPGIKFHQIEQSFFLGIYFRFPLPKGVVSSGFGYRNDPFNSRRTQFHPGIDLAAPEGTPVFASREGKVVETGFNEIYGNFIRIIHSGGYETVYGHLKTIAVSPGISVSSTTIIGNVGSTGQSTGPHLHFEIRKSGSPRDPGSYIKKIGS